MSKGSTKCKHSMKTNFTKCIDAIMSEASSRSAVRMKFLRCSFFLTFIECDRCPSVELCIEHTLLTVKYPLFVYVYTGILVSIAVCTNMHVCVTQSMAVVTIYLSITMDMHMQTKVLCARSLPT